MTSVLSSPGPPSANTSLNASAIKTAYLLAVHEASRGYVIAYVCLVLVFYTVGMTVLLARHFRRAENQPRLAVFYQAIINRTASLRRRRTDDAGARAAPQVVVHEPEVSPGPSGGASVGVSRADCGLRRATARTRPLRPVDEIIVEDETDESSPERTRGRVFRETDF